MARQTPLSRSRQSTHAPAQSAWSLPKDVDRSIQDVPNIVDAPDFQTEIFGGLLRVRRFLEECAEYPSGSEPISVFKKDAETAAHKLMAGIESRFNSMPFLNIPE